jgi:hypothetical protein
VEVWFRLSLLFTIFSWLAVVVGLVAVYYSGLPGGSNVIVCAAPLAIVSSVATFLEWRVQSAED